MQFGKASLSFEQNAGQDKSSARFIAYGQGYLLRLEPSRASIEFHPKDAKVDSSKPSTLDLRFLGARAAPAMTASEKLVATRSYFPASNPATWLRNLPTYGRVQYQDIYPGVGLSFYGNDRRLEYDFTLRPGADAGLIKVALDGTDLASLDKDGNLSLRAHGSDLTLLKPVAYQVDGSSRQLVKVEYSLQTGNESAHTSPRLTFRLGRYDHKRPLIIDPVLVYGVYLPGAPGYAFPPYYYFDTDISAMTADPAGNTYVAAFVRSSNSDFSVLKFDAAGNLLFNVSIGSQFVRSGVNKIAVDAAGDIYIAGAAGPGLVTTPGAYQASSTATYYGQDSGFLTVIRSDASALIYSTYLGGSGSGTIAGLAVDASGKAYVTGSGDSRNFPTTPGVYEPSIPSPAGNTVAFAAKLDPVLSGNASLVYSTLLGATQNNSGISNGNAIAVDASGNAYVAVSAGPDYPVTETAYAYAGVSPTGGYVTKLDPTASTLIYSAFLGPGIPRAIALDGSGEAYVTGPVIYGDYPTTPGAYQTTYPGGFVSKLSSDGAALLYSTFLGGPSSAKQSGAAAPTSITLLPGCASACNAYVAGTTSDIDFPILNPIQSFIGAFPPSVSSTQAFMSGFLVDLAPDGTSAKYSTYLGAATSPTYGSYDTPGVAADQSGNIYFGSNVQGMDAPVTLPSTPYPGEGFLLKIGPADAGAIVTLPAQVSFFTGQPVHSTSTTPGTVQLRNMGSQPVTLNQPFVFSSSEFSETDNCPATLPAGDLCLLNVSFTPAASGTRTANLTISSNATNSPATVALVGIAIDAPNLTASSTSLTFPDQVVGSTSVTQTVTLTNTGNQPQPFTLDPVLPADFLVSSNCPAQAAPGASCQITFRFSPTQIGLRSNNLFVREPGYHYQYGFNYPNGFFIYLTGTGVLNAAGTGTLIVSESALNFGSLVVGSSAITQSITLTNSGSAPVSLNSLALIPSQGSTGEYSLTSGGSGNSDCTSPYNNPPLSYPVQLYPQYSCEIAITFNPSTAGQALAVLQINDSASGSPQTVTLSGMGLQSAQPLTISPATMAFRAQPLESSSAPQSFFITNEGESFITIDRATTTGDFGVQSSNSTCEGATLGPRGSCSVNVIFTPEAVGSRSGTLTVIDALSGNPQVFNLTGSGIQATGTLVLGQSSLIFPAQAEGSTSATEELIVSNPGNSPVSINSLATTGDFAVIAQYFNGSCGEVLAPVSTCSVGIAFSPMQPNGSETGTLTIHSTVGNLTVNLSGSSFTAPQVLHLTPTAVDFGNVKVATNEPVTIWIENVGAEPIIFSSQPTITGISSTPAADFKLNVNCNPYFPYSPSQPANPFPPGQSCSLTIAFVPSTQGMEKATFTLVDSAGTQSIALSGVGVGADPPAALLPPVLTFSQAAVGFSSSPYSPYGVAFTIYGNQPITVNSVSVTAGSGDFSLKNGSGSCVGNIYYSCYVGIDFHPSTQGYRTGTLTLKDASGNTYTAALAGLGVRPVKSATITPQALLLPSAPAHASSYPASGPVTSVTLRNTGNVLLTVGNVAVTPSGDFSIAFPNGSDQCSGRAFPPGGYCSVNVAFTPQVTGVRHANLSIPFTYADATTASLVASLSGTGLQDFASANLLPQSAAFADQVAGSQTFYNLYPRNFVLTNTGTTALTIQAMTGTDLTTIPESKGDFYVNYNYCSSYQPLAPGASCSVGVSFAPITAGAKMGSITLPVTYSGGMTASFTATLSGKAIAAAPQLRISPTGLNFNVQVVGTTDNSNSQTVDLTAIGNAPVTITSVTASPNFTVAQNGCSTSVSLTYGCAITLQFTPLSSTAPGAVNGTLTILDNAPGSPHTVALRGTAVSPSAALVVSQSYVWLGSATVGSTTSQQVIYLTDLNPSGVLTQINSIKLGGNNAQDFTETENCGGSLGFSINGRQTCMITVAFAPKAGSIGTRQAMVTITPATGPPLVIQLAGKGIAGS